MRFFESGESRRGETEKARNEKAGRRTAVTFCANDAGISYFSFSTEQLDVDVCITLISMAVALVGF